MDKVRRFHSVGVRWLLLLGAVFFFWANISAQVRPHRSGGERKLQESSEVVQLVYADNVIRKQFDNPDAQRFSGNVQFYHAGMHLYCDSAVLYQESNSFEAFGHVRILQGDTLSLTGARLYYNGNDLLAEMRENVVMKHRQQTLYTDSLNYDRLYNYAYFFDSGKLVDGDNVLTSDWGEYHTDTKQSTFNYQVELVSPKFRLVSDTLHYDTQTKWANVMGPSNIYSDDNRIYTEHGYYNTQTEEIRLFDRSHVYNQGRNVVGDTIYYDKATGITRAYRNIYYEDLKNKNIMTGDYCLYNEITGEAVAYDRALIKDFSNGNDTLFLHADTLRLYTYNIDTDSVYRKLHAYFHVRAYRTDIQAVADSAVFNSRLQRLRLYKDPIVWSDMRQIVGEEISVFVNDSTLDSIYVDRQALLVERLDSVHYNQIAGQQMRSYFERGEMKLNCVDGNVYVINYPLEKDSSILYQNYTETTKLRMYMENRKMKRLWAPASQGCFYAVGMAPPERTYLSNFAWFDYIRPRDKYDLFEWRPKKKGMELKPSVRHEAPLQTLGKKSNEEKPEPLSDSSQPAAPANEDEE